MNFEAFSLHPQIHAGITQAGYITPTPIQSQAIPPILAGKDVLGLAQTGTGKTAAFGLPILQRLLRGPRGRLRALILSPTRELAEQTHAAITALGRQTGLRSVTIYGGVGAQPQIRALKAGVEIVVACPGRLLDLMAQKAVDLRSLEILVVDEADQMFDMGFMPSIRRILAALPAQRQTLLFSATMPAEIRSFATDLLKDPVTVEVNITRPIETIRHAVYPVDSTQKSEMLLGLLAGVDAGQVLVFTRTKYRARKVAGQLARAGLSATALHGNLSQSQRQTALDGFRTGKVRILVATDIAARGIDISRISHVINYDIPDTVEAYTHRIGRTGRMAARGTAYTLITSEDSQMVRSIERALGKPLERQKLAGFETVTVMPEPRPALPPTRAHVPTAGRRAPRPAARAQARRTP